MSKLFILFLVCVYSPAEAKEKTFMERVFYALHSSDSVSARRSVRRAHHHVRARRNVDAKVLHRMQYSCVPTASTFDFSPVPPVKWENVTLTWQSWATTYSWGNFLSSNAWVQ